MIYDTNTKGAETYVCEHKIKKQTLKVIPYEHKKHGGGRCCKIRSLLREITVIMVQYEIFEMHRLIDNLHLFTQSVCTDTFSEQRKWGLRFCFLYAVKVQRSLAPLSRFRGSHITTAHEQCCRFQSYAKSVPSPMKLTSEIDKA